MKKILPILISLVAAWPLSAATSEIVGFVSVDLSPGLNFLSIPFVESEEYTGSADSVSGNTVTIASNSLTGLDFSGSHYLEFLNAGDGGTGGGKGMIIEIASNTANSITLVDSVDGLGLEGNELFRVVAFKTIASVFGAENASGLTGGSTATSADEIQIWNPLTQRFSSYFYSSLFNEWKSVTNPTGPSVNETVFYPDQGFVVNRKSDPLELVLIGKVKLEGTQGLVFSGFNFYSNAKPVDIRLDETGWEASVTQSSTATNADEIGVWNPVTQTLTNYFFSSLFGEWKASAAPTGANAGPTIIPASASVLIFRKTGDTVVSESDIVVSE